MTASSSIGFGLTVMRERVQSLGGEWELSDNWPSGATIAATLPLGAPSAALATGGA
jgi:two-component system, NarL family, sensor histidine kinase UhpB